MSLEENLNKAKCIITVWSNSSIQSKWVLAETQLAFNRNILVPVIFQHTDIPLPFHIIQAEDLTLWDMKNNGYLKKLTLSINKILSGENLQFLNINKEDAKSNNQQYKLISHTVKIRDREYSAQIPLPSINVSLAELIHALEEHRKTIKLSEERMREAYIMEAFEYAPPWNIRYAGPTNDAIISHLSIQMLIPMIKQKGGIANFEEAETLDVKTRIELMQNSIEKSVFIDKPSNKSSIFVTAIALSLIIFLLLSITFI